VGDINRTVLANDLKELTPKGKDPHSVSVLDKWIALAENEMGLGQSGRLAWLIASTVVTAKLQQVLDDAGNGRFLLKGGTLLQHRLSPVSRATRDLDGMIRGDIEDFLVHLDDQLREPWGPIEFMRSEAAPINMPTMVIKPQRFDMILLLRGRVWRKITVEVSPGEGSAASLHEEFPAPSLAGFGLPTPERLIGLSMGYQVAQKVHAASSPHDPPVFINNRPRDVVDLLLIKELINATGNPGEDEIISAIIDIFEARGREAKVLERPVQEWPAQIVAYPHWEADYTDAAGSVGVTLKPADAVAQLNEWLESFGSRL
jgi:hypothetical protein